MTPPVKPQTPEIDKWWESHGAGGPEMTWGSDGPYSEAYAALDQFYGGNAHPTDEELAANAPLPDKREYDALGAWQTAYADYLAHPDTIVKAPEAAQPATGVVLGPQAHATAAAAISGITQSATPEQHKWLWTLLHALRLT